MLTPCHFADARGGVSVTHGASVMAAPSAETGQQLFIPTGFLHDLLTLSSDCEVQYTGSGYDASESEGSAR